MIAFVFVFSVMLIVSVALTYINNLKMYTYNLQQQSEMNNALLDKNITDSGNHIYALGKSTNFTALLNTVDSDTQKREALVKATSNDIKNSIGQTKIFEGVSVRNTQGDRYFEGSDLKQMDDLVDRVVDLKQINFSEQNFYITFCEEDDESLMIVTTAIGTEKSKPIGFLHVVFNSQSFYLSDTSEGQDSLLINTKNWAPIMVQNYEGMEKANEKIANSNDLIEGAMNVLDAKDTFEYRNENGKWMIGFINRNDDYSIALISAVEKNLMNQSVLSYSFYQIIVSAILLVILALGMYFIYRRSNKPITEMIEKCKQIADGDGEVIFEEETDTDLSLLAKTFNEYRKKIEWAAYIDTKFDIGNLLKSEKDINRIIGERGQKEFSLFFIDIIDFGKYNEIFSVDIGNEILEAVCKALNEIFQGKLYRLCGDEFLGINYFTEGNDGIIFDITKMLEDKIIVRSTAFQLKCKIGICHYPIHGKTAEELIEKGESALNEAKNRIEEQVVFYNHAITQSIKRRNKIKALLMEHIACEDFDVWYQPIYDVLSGEFVSAEALLRLQDEKGIFISPAEAISTAENYNLTDAIGEIVLKKACNIVRHLESKNSTVKTIFVNLSVQQLMQKNYASKIKTILNTHGVRPEQIGIEVTEPMLIYSFDSAVNVLNQLRTAGVWTALDDFGSGFSSLTYLSKIPIDILKFDRQMVLQAMKSDEQYEFIKAVVGLTHVKHIKVVAEGVEEINTLEKIRSCEVDFIQGYYYSKPLSEKDLFEFLENQKDN